VPLDFVSTHHYPTDALGSIGEDTETQLAHSRRSILREWAQETHRNARGKPVYYTEWNSSSDPRDHLHDEPYTAAVVVKTMMEACGLVQGYSFWTFSDIFEENYFPSIPFHGGFGLLNLYGIAKPAYRAFQLLHRSGTDLLEFNGAHATVDAWVIRKNDAATIIMTNLAMPRHAIQSELVNVRLSGAPTPRIAWIERIDEEHANPRRLWQNMGEPEYLSALQVQQLEAASTLRTESQPWTYEEGNVDLCVSLPPQSVAAITIDFA